MISKDLNEILNKTRRTPNISLTAEQVEELVKKLEVLEILRDDIAYVDIVKDQKETLEITIRVKEENRSKIKEWLNEKNA